MKTRTLLLLAIGCGLAILLAGGIWLLRLVDAPEAAPPLKVGESGQAGDLVATVEAIHEQDGVLRVEMALSGVEDPDVLDGFRLSILEGLVEPDPDPVTTDDLAPCRAATLAEQSCVLVFDIGETDGSTRLLLLRRGEDRLSWDLS